MSLPFILDITIGLIFIYLILSLLASEIQELITTVLQWRAVHLKNSIEVLIAGDAESSDDDTVIAFVNKLYEYPLIKSVNQEAKGFWADLPRRFVWVVSSFLSKFLSFSKHKEISIFGDKKHSAPSYISAETFAITLLETLHLPEIVKRITEFRTLQFEKKQLNEIISIVNEEHLTEIITTSFENIIEDFRNDKVDLVTTISRMKGSFDRYIKMVEGNVSEDVLQKLILVKEDIFDNIQETIIFHGLVPSINEVVDFINVGSNVHKKLRQELESQDSAVYQQIKDIYAQLPPSLLNSIANLAKYTQARATNTQEGIQILQRQIEHNFDKSMERAAGVYKRNAKGVALLIGFSIAVVANADTFHIVSRLSKDSAIRTAIINNAGEIVQNSSLNDIKAQTDNALSEVGLPIGWSGINLQQQIDLPADKKELNLRSVTWENVSISKLLTMICGWLVTGLAIAMGAPFWFDLLGKVVNVRNTGKSPSAARTRK